MERRDNGFTLIEVMAVVAILGIVAIPLLSLFTSAWQSTHAARRHMMAVYVGQTIMEEVVATRPEHRPGLATVGRVAHGHGFTYERTVSPLGSRLLQVTVVVYWLDDDVEKSYRVVTKLAGP